MIHVSAKNIKQAWRDSLRRLYDDGQSDPLKEFYRASPAVIQVEDTKDEHYDEFYPLPVADIAEGNRYLITGEGEEGQSPILRLYRKRLFGSGQNENEENFSENQIGRIVEYLRRMPHGKKAIVSLWRPEDMEAEDGSLLHGILFYISDNTLHTHVHSAETDGYRHLLPDMSRFAALQHHVASRLGIPHGKYAYFSDSLHFHENDRDHVDLLLAP